MNCPKCNAELVNNALFCSVCGTKMQETQEQEVQVETKDVKIEETMIKKKSRKNIIMLASFAILAIFFWMLSMTGIKTRTINLNDYLVVEYEGGNSSGKAQIYIDELLLRLDYEDEIEFLNDSAEAVLESTYGVKHPDPIDGILNVVNVEVK